MKKTLLFLGTIAVSAVTSGVTVWAVDRSHTDKIEYIEREVERTPALGSHFTAYEADKYPDLTYAAENAVKAVVNIEAIQQVDVSSGYGGGAYDPFFEFFGHSAGLRSPRRPAADAGAPCRRFGRHHLRRRIYRDEQPRDRRRHEAAREAQRRPPSSTPR